MIRGLAKNMGWDEDPKRLRGFLETRFGVADVAFLTQDKASNVIEALKAMTKREKSKSKRGEAESGSVPEGGQSS